MSASAALAAAHPVVPSLLEARMQLTQEQIQTLKQFYLSRGDVLETAMKIELLKRGIDEQRARQAAKQCADLVWRNGIVAGAGTGLLTFLIAKSPVISGLAGGSAAALAGSLTFTYADACEMVRGQDEVEKHVDEIMKQQSSQRALLP